jgi:hypothetical protein
MTADTRVCAFQRLFRSTNMRPGRVPFFSLPLSPSRPVIRPGPPALHSFPSVVPCFSQSSCSLSNQKPFYDFPGFQTASGSAETLLVGILRSNVTFAYCIPPIVAAFFVYEKKLYNCCYGVCASWHEGEIAARVRMTTT